VIDEWPSRLCIALVAFGFDGAELAPVPLLYLPDKRRRFSHRMKKSPVWTSPPAKGCSPIQCGSPIWCFFPPAAPSFTGIVLVIQLLLGAGQWLPPVTKSARPHGSSAR
jgi:hypothetical protein